MFDPISGRNSIPGMFMNPTMLKVATMVVSGKRNNRSIELIKRNFFE